MLQGQQELLLIFLRLTSYGGIVAHVTEGLFAAIPEDPSHEGFLIIQCQPCVKGDRSGISLLCSERLCSGLIYYKERSVGVVLEGAALQEIRGKEAAEDPQNLDGLGCGICFQLGGNPADRGDFGDALDIGKPFHIPGIGGDGEVKGDTGFPMYLQKGADTGEDHVDSKGQKHQGHEPKPGDGQEGQLKQESPFYAFCRCTFRRLLQGSHLPKSGSHTTRSDWPAPAPPVHGCPGEAGRWDA